MPAILNLSLIKNKLKNLFSDKKVIDIILFGSAIKGKLIPGDVDIAAILYEKPSKEFLEKIDKLIEQNKLVAKSLSLMGDQLKERIYPARIRPRFTWHGGEAPTAISSENEL